MNIQLKKGLVEVCVLALLKQSPSYGYKIVSDISSIIEISESTLYPVLRRLETGGYLETFSKDFNGRLRKYYKTTRLGLLKIEEFKEEWEEMETVYCFIKEKGAL